LDFGGLNEIFLACGHLEYRLASFLFQRNLAPMSISGAFRPIAVFLFYIFSIPAQGNPALNAETASFESMIDQIKAGIENVVHVVSPRYDASVESYLRSYIQRSPDKTALMIGRSTLYFPMFESELAAGGLPTDLKYLAVIESALTPRAVSPVGAAGLWQFMRPTARECGLYVTKYVDERCDPVKATRAAIKYLSFLHEQFDSWELAMAAYNSGPGRVRYAIRRSGTKDYWKLQRYLPRETRSYVPGFIAASYILNFYADHGLVPEYPSSDFTQTESVQVFKGLSFSEISSVTGVPVEVIRELNPVFVRNYIPESSNGYTIALPDFAATTLQVYLMEDAASVEASEFEGIETGVDVEFVDRLVEEVYLVESGDNLYNIARENGCTVDDLKTWNHLSGNTIHIGQRLKMKKMAKVLIRVSPPPPPTRTQVHIATLPVVALVSDPGRAIRTFSISDLPQPVVHETQSIILSPVVIRRRTSLRWMGVDQVPQSTALTPGTRIQ